MIGSFGGVVFEVSDEKVRTFRDYQIQRSAKYSEHAIHGRKGLLEFTGLSPVSASLAIKLDAGHRRVIGSYKTRSSKGNDDSKIYAL
ncbi:MAG: hypothetical protein IJT21_03140 [Synergistaceae bacterium]|nr:hypothetical protein [Synergistaceae bacterium]